MSYVKLVLDSGDDFFIDVGHGKEPTGYWIVKINGGTDEECVANAIVFLQGISASSEYVSGKSKASHFIDLVVPCIIDYIKSGSVRCSYGGNACIEYELFSDSFEWCLEI